MASCLCALKERKVFRRELLLGFQIHLNVKRGLGTLSPFVQDLFGVSRVVFRFVYTASRFTTFHAGKDCTHRPSVLFVPHLDGLIWKMLIWRGVADSGSRNRNAQVI